MEMLDVLRFVRGAVATKNFAAELKHFVIEDGRIRAYNGVIALSSPIDFGVDCKPLATTLVSAISHCEDTTHLGMTATGRLRVQSGKFKAFVDCIDEIAISIVPEGDHVDIDGESLLAAIDVLLPFVSDDAARPWANGILLRDQSAFATNNVCLVEYWLGAHAPFEANIPIHAIKELKRIGEPPTHVQICDHSITFHYPDDRWLRSQLYTTEWPDLVKVLNVENVQQPIPDEFFVGIETIKPFSDREELVYFRDGQLCSSPDDGLGASYAVEGLPEKGLFKIPMMQLLKDVAQTIDLAAYPGACIFMGENIRGAIMGRRY